MNKDRLDVLVMVLATAIGVYFATFSNPMYCVVGLIAALTAWNLMPKMSSKLRSSAAS